MALKQEKIKIGTRGSKLAIWQANYVSDLLKKHNFETEIVIIETKGDKILDTSISKIGSKGVFTEELETQLRDGKIHIAVHSAKDLQSQLPDDLEIIAFTKREKPNDVILSLNERLPKINERQAFTIGTSSTRRIALLKHYYPHIRTVEMRGNLQTRFQKMESGACDALILAYAGIHRMDYDIFLKETLDTDTFTPPVGQGSIAIEVLKNNDNDRIDQLRSILNHSDTEKCLLSERKYLERLQGGCSIPVFALAEINNDKIILRGGIVSLNGKHIIKFSVSSSIESFQADLLGNQLAEKVLNSGGDKILNEIKQNLNKVEIY